MPEENPTQLPLELLSTNDLRPCTPLEWLTRSYKTLEYWKQEAKELFFSLNGQSDVARNRLAMMIRKHFVDTPPISEDVTRWKRDSTETETIRMTPPRISASNCAYIDWGYIADYMLLACAAVSEEIETENQKRSAEYLQSLESFNIRQAVFDARTILREQPNLNDDEVFAILKTMHPNAAVAHVKEAKKLERSAAHYVVPKPPNRSPELNLYVPLYF
jgi:hypothetical protein